MTVKVALVISDKNYRASPSGKGSIRKVQTGIFLFRMNYLISAIAPYFVCGRYCTFK